MSKQYRNAPIIEALCEFQFNADVAWDITLTGLIYEKLKIAFPKKQQLQNNIALAVASGSSLPSDKPLLIPLIRFSNEDETSLVQLGYNLLTVNQLKPYNSWKELLLLTKNVFNDYLEIAKPVGFSHISVRYINLIEIPESNFNLEEAFQFRPAIPTNLSQKSPDGFLTVVDLPYEDTQDILRIQLGSVSSTDPSLAAVKLEISYVFAKPETIALKGVLDKLELAHEHIGKAFEACLTDKIKKTFDEVTE